MKTKCRLRNRISVRCLSISCRKAPEDDGIAYLSFYLEEDADQEAVLGRVREELETLRGFMEIGEGTIVQSQTEEKDWINNWKEYFHQFYVDDILIIPSWEEVKEEDKDKNILHIDPGTAFGTGMHETTQLCLRQLKKYVKPGMTLLDVGTGSGILSIAALKMGAGKAVGTDLDPCALSAVLENLEANEIPKEAMEVYIGNLIDDKSLREKAGYEAYDLVTANILTEVLVPLTPGCKGASETRRTLHYLRHPGGKRRNHPKSGRRGGAGAGRGNPAERLGFRDSQKEVNDVSFFCGTGADRRKRDPNLGRRRQPYPQCPAHEAGGGDYRGKPRERRPEIPVQD